MDFSKFLSYATDVLGTGLSDTQMASKIGEILGEESEKMDLVHAQLSFLFGAVNAFTNDDLTSEVEDLIEVATSHNLTSFSLCGPNGTDFDAIPFELDIPNGLLKISDAVICQKNEALKWIRSNNPIASLKSIPVTDTLLDQISQSIGSTMAMSQILSKASILDWSSDKASSAINSIIDDFKSLPGSIKTSLKSATTNGLYALTTCVQSIWKGLETGLTDTQSDPELHFVSTTVQVKDFAWGLVGSTVGSILSAVGLALTAVSRVVGLMVSIAGAVVSFAANFAKNVAEQIAGTQFTIVKGSTTPSFALVLNRYTMVNRDLAAAILAQGSSGATITGPAIPVTLLCNVMDADAKEPSTVYVEEIPSVNFDMIATGKGADVGTIASDFPDLVASDATQSIFFGRVITYRNPDATLNKYSVSFGIDESFNLSTIVEGAWSPTTFKNYDVIKQVWTDDNPYLATRLATSMFLWALSIFETPLEYLSNVAGQVGGIAFCKNDYLHPASTVLNKRSGCLSNILMFLGNFLASCYKNGPSTYTEPTVTTAALDNLLLNISARFDDLDYLKHVNDFGTLPDFGYILPGETSSTPNYVIHDISSYDNSYANNTGITIGYQIASGYASGRVSILTSNVYTGTPLVPTINLPSLTFSGFMKGLIIDGLILVGLAVVTAAAIAVSVVIKNAVMKAENNADRLWYKHQDEINKGQTEAAQETWRQYKRAKFKLKLGNFLTGGLEQATNLTTDENQSASYDLAYIKYIITGSR